MTKPVKLRMADPSDSEDIVKWSQNNLEDKSILLHESTIIACAENGVPITYVIMHPVLVIDALAPGPETTTIQRTLAMQAILDGAVKISNQFNIPEIMFFGDTDDDQLQALAESRGQFEKVPFSVWRRKVTNG